MDFIERFDIDILQKNSNCLLRSRHYRTKVDSSKKSISFENKDAYIWLTIFTPIVLYSCNSVENMCV